MLQATGISVRTQWLVALKGYMENWSVRTGPGNGSQVDEKLPYIVTQDEGLRPLDSTPVFFFLEIIEIIVKLKKCFPHQHLVCAP